MKNIIKKVVLIGGGVGSSTFTNAIKDLPIDLSTIISVFDDGGSTGAIRRDYGGIAVGDLRQCILASLQLKPQYLATLNYRFGKGNLFGINVGNLLLKSFLQQYRNKRAGMVCLHKLFGLRNKIIPVSYGAAKLCAALSNANILEGQNQIASYYSFERANIKSLYLYHPVKLNPDAGKAIKQADYLIFTPGHFFSSLLPNIYVNGFASAWRANRGKKIWFVNLLAHRGQDSFYTLMDYLHWFQNKLGRKPFDLLVTNKEIPKKVLDQVRDRFEPVKITPEDKIQLHKLGIGLAQADLVSYSIRQQQVNDTVLRAPLRHDAKKIQDYFKKDIII